MSSEPDHPVNSWEAADGKTYSEVVEQVSEFYRIPATEAEDAIDQAVEAGELVEDNSGTYPRLQVPGSESDDSDGTYEDSTTNVSKEDVQQCLNDILDWYHEQVDEPFEHDEGEYDTPREYLHERGWTDETIDEKKLGYAPPNRHLHGDLVPFLLEYGWETFRATGLFAERGDGFTSSIWNGRFVFPYPDEEGNLVYAISRADSPPHEDDWAGRYSEDDTPSKYHKIPTTRDEVIVEEPIYGVDTIEPGEPVLITEGIADAITAHQHGYACISPVTTQFSDENLSRLADVLKRHGVTQVFIVQDSERPTSSVVDTQDGEEKLQITQFGPGEKGAVKTASKLVADGIDARVGEIPRLGLDKVDLDDYLHQWDGDLAAVLRSARPPSEHPASVQLRPSTEVTRELYDQTVESTTHSSALWELDITDVSGRDVEFRGKNPLGHHGDSEDYFVVIDDQVAYDHKYKTAYNALTYLLCEAGIRDDDRPGGSLSDTEVWNAWVYAKESAYISPDDKCPSAALRHVALKHDVCDPSDIIGGWKLRRDAYEATLDIIENEYDVEHGHPVGGERVSTVPLEQIQRLSWDEARRFARDRGFEWPSTRQARTRLEDTVVRSVARQDHNVIDAPTALGKSHTVATFPWLDYGKVTGGAPVVMVHPTRDARDEAYNASNREGLTSKKILGRKEACPVAAGEYDDEITMNGESASKWIDRQCEGKGVPFSVAHSILAENNDQDTDLACSPGDDKCRSETQWEDVPWYTPDENNGFGGCAGVNGVDGNEKHVRYDVVHATHPMLYVPSMTKDTNVVIDELPDYALRIGDGDREGGISMDRIQNAVTAYLQAIDAPVTTWEAFISLARARSDDEFGDLHGSFTNQYIELKEAVEERSPQIEWYVENPDAHVLSRAVIECVNDAFESDADRNDLRHGTTMHTLPRMDDKEARVRVSLVIDDNNRIQTIRQTPDMSTARSVAGLDAHPAMPLWQLNSVEHIQREEVLDTGERRFWRIFERGLFVVQIGESTRPLSGPNAKEWFSEEKLDVLLNDLVDEGLETGITTAQIESELASLLEENGVDIPRTLHYGEIRSRNDFGGEDIGFVNGCMDPGDDFVLTVLAEYGCDAEPESVVDEDGIERRAHGRGFTGPDAETAAEILASVRENEVAQAAGRYARNADNQDDRAVVYVRTDASPTGFSDVQVGGVKWVATAKQAEIIQSLKSDAWLTAKEIADEIDSTKRHVLKTLKKLRDRDIVDYREGAGKYGADLYRAVTGRTTTHLTDLGPSLSQGYEMDGAVWALVVRDVDANPQES